MQNCYNTGERIPREKKFEVDDRLANKHIQTLQFVQEVVNENKVLKKRIEELELSTSNCDELHALAEESKTKIKTIQEQYLKRADEINAMMAEKHRDEVRQGHKDYDSFIVIDDIEENKMRVCDRVKEINHMLKVKHKDNRNHVVCKRDNNLENMIDFIANDINVPAEYIIGKVKEISDKFNEMLVRERKEEIRQKLEHTTGLKKYKRNRRSNCSRNHDMCVPPNLYKNTLHIKEAERKDSAELAKHLEERRAKEILESRNVTSEKSLQSDTDASIDKRENTKDFTMISKPISRVHVKRNEDKLKTFVDRRTHTPSHSSNVLNSLSAVGSKHKGHVRRDSNGIETSIPGSFRNSAHRNSSLVIKENKESKDNMLSNRPTEIINVIREIPKRCSEEEINSYIEHNPVHYSTDKIGDDSDNIPVRCSSEEVNNLLENTSFQYNPNEIEPDIEDMPARCRSDDIIAYMEHTRPLKSSNNEMVYHGNDHVIHRNSSSFSGNKEGINKNISRATSIGHVLECVNEKEHEIGRDEVGTFDCTLHYNGRVGSKRSVVCSNVFKEPSNAIDKEMLGDVYDKESTITRKNNSMKKVNDHTEVCEDISVNYIHNQSSVEGFRPKSAKPSRLAKLKTKVLAFDAVMSELHRVKKQKDAENTEKKNRAALEEHVVNVDGPVTRSCQPDTPVSIDERENANDLTIVSKPISRGHVRSSVDKINSFIVNSNERMHMPSHSSFMLNSQSAIGSIQKDLVGRNSNGTVHSIPGNVRNSAHKNDSILIKEQKEAKRDLLTHSDSVYENHHRPVEINDSIREDPMGCSAEEINAYIEHRPLHYNFDGTENIPVRYNADEVNSLLEYTPFQYSSNDIGTDIEDMPARCSADDIIAYIEHKPSKSSINDFFSPESSHLSRRNSSSCHWNKEDVTQTTSRALSIGYGRKSDGRINSQLTSAYEVMKRKE